jgi:hypothetical protein
MTALSDATIDALSDDALGVVFAHVMVSNPLNLFLDVVRVCRRWARVSREHVVLEVTGRWCHGSKFATTQAVYRRCLTEATRFRRVAAFKAYEVAGLSMLLAQPSATRLKTLNLAWTTNTASVLPGVVQSCAGLTTLDIDGSSRADFCARTIAGGFPHLTTLLMAWCTSLTDAGLRAIAAGGFPSLARLKLKGCENITTGGLRVLARGALPQLASLDLSYLFITDEALEVLAGGGFPRLASLDLSCCSAITDAGLRALACGGLPLLASLDLSHTLIMDEGLQALAGGGLPRLTLLGLRHRRRLTDAGLRALATAMPRCKTVGADGRPLP